MKVCKKCEKECPATLEFFHTNKKNGRSFLYSVCKDCKRKKYEKKPLKTATCEYCGKDIQCGRSDKKYCSRKCRTYKGLGRPLNKNGTRKNNGRKCVHCKQNKTKWKNKYCDQCKFEVETRICTKCNNVFSIERYQRTKCCSEQCKGKDSIRKKKIHDEINDVFLSRTEVFELEGYECKNCGCTTDKKLGYIKGTLIIKPSAPTIDHIIPLSLGGTHTVKNVQLLCYKCNHDKQDGFLESGEQLKMF